MSRLCIVKVCHYQAQENLKKKIYLQCNECIFKDSCKNKDESMENNYDKNNNS